MTASTSIHELIKYERLGLNSCVEGRLRSLLVSHGILSYKDILKELLAQMAKDQQIKNCELKEKQAHFCPYYGMGQHERADNKARYATTLSCEGADLSDVSRDEALEMFQFDTQIELNGLAPEVEALLKQTLIMNGISLQTLFPALFEQLEARAVNTFRP